MTTDSATTYILMLDWNMYLFIFRHSSKNYGLVMTGQAAAAPVIALLTEFLSPALGWLGKYYYMKKNTRIETFVFFFTFWMKKNITF